MISAAVLVIGIGVGVFVLAEGRADQSPDSGPGWSAQTFAETPAFPETGSGTEKPPDVAYRLAAPLHDYLTVELRSGWFTWIPVSDPGSGSEGKPVVSLAGYSGGCPGEAAPGMVCPAQWQARYARGPAGVETVHWTLLALPPPMPGIEQTSGAQSPPPLPVPGSACPATLPVPLTSTVEGCVVATATIVVDVSDSTSSNS